MQPLRRAKPKPHFKCAREGQKGETTTTTTKMKQKVPHDKWSLNPQIQEQLWSLITSSLPRTKAFIVLASRIPEFL